MRKFLMAAAVLAVAACGEKKPSGQDTTTMAPAAPPAMTSMDSMKADSIKKDSIRKADSMRTADSMAKKPPAKP